MKTTFIKIGLFVLAFALCGCSTPAGMKWQKQGNSVETTNADIHGCKVNTALWWPFDDLSRCMHRRGYKLIGENEGSENVQSYKGTKTEDENQNYIKLVELKKLKDDGIISNEEYEIKRKKYISTY